MATPFARGHAHRGSTTPQGRALFAGAIGLSPALVLAFLRAHGVATDAFAQGGGFRGARAPAAMAAAAAPNGAPRISAASSATASAPCGGAAVVVAASAFAAAAARRHRGARRRALGAVAATTARGAATTRLAATATDNVAVVFLKPHASTDQARAFVPEFLTSRGMSIVRTGSTTGAEIDKRGIIDAHYSSIAKVGMARDMRNLGLSAAAAEKFKKGFGVALDEAIDAGRVHTAATALQALQVTPSELLDQCLAVGYEKLQSGTYVAKLTAPDGKPTYVLNGFYARMREKFVTPDVVLAWYIVRFNPAELSWRSFRREVIGVTNPDDAVEGSLRAKFRDEWRTLGLKAQCNYQDNGVHASASPLEAMKERNVWAGEALEADVFGAALLARGVSPEHLIALADDTQVELVDGRRGRVFDFMEEVNTEEALDLLSSAKVLDS